MVEDITTIIAKQKEEGKGCGGCFIGSNGEKGNLLLLFLVLFLSFILLRMQKGK